MFQVREWLVIIRVSHWDVHFEKNLGICKFLKVHFYVELTFTVISTRVEVTRTPFNNDDTRLFASECANFLVFSLQCEERQSRLAGHAERFAELVDVGGRQPVERRLRRARHRRREANPPRDRQLEREATHAVHKRRLPVVACPTAAPRRRETQQGEWKSPIFPTFATLFFAAAAVPCVPSVFKPMLFFTPSRRPTFAAFCTSKIV